MGPLTQDDPGLDVAVGARAVYDAVADAYEAQFSDELAAKPLDRALLAAVAELGSGGTIADVGCGPGHVTRHLAERHAAVVGVDLSPRMVAIARNRAPELPFVVGSLLGLPLRDGSCTGALALYSIIHLAVDERAQAFRELARVLRPGGWLLVAFHVDSAGFAAGEVNGMTTFLGRRVQLAGYFLDPRDVLTPLRAAGLTPTATLERAPVPDVEYPSRRCYVLARR